jgi:hypothetical protein
MSNDRRGAEVDEQVGDALANGRLASAGVTLRKGGRDVAVVGRNLFNRRCRICGFALGSLLGFTGMDAAPRAASASG